MPTSSYPPRPPHLEPSVARRASGPRRAALTFLALLLALTTLALGAAAPASAGTVYEIDGEWRNAPATIARGNPVVAEWRVNVNDDQPAPSNDPVENVTATFTVAKAFFDGIPSLCKTTGVTPRSAISADGTTLTCNFGTVEMGTALIVQTPVVANGSTGEEIVLDGTSPGGETRELPPVPIRNPFVMDMQFAGTSTYQGAWNDLDAPAYVDVPFNWSVRMGNGSDPGPNTLSYRLTLADVNGRPVVLGTHPTGAGLAKNYGVQGCTEHDLGQADGHPYSTVPTNTRHTNFVDSCTLTPVTGQSGVFTLTLTGIDYDLVNAPTHDSFGNPLPANWDYVAAGQIWIRVQTSQSGSVRLTSNAPTYTSPSGQQYTDPASNNAATKTYTLPGGFSAAYLRNYTGNGGDRWDDTYRVAAGTTVWTYVANHFSSDSVADTAGYGVCQALDTQYVDFDPNRPMEFLTSFTAGGSVNESTPRGGVVEYYTGPLGDPNTFNCGTGTWSAAQPADPTTISAVRWRYPHSLYSANDALGFQMRVPTRVQDDVAIGQDIWTFGSYQRNDTWVTPADVPPGVTPTPGERYDYTNGRRDVLWVVLANPAIRKNSAQNTVTPGVPAEFTLSYSANGTGTVPPEVDDYVITDTLPVGMTYVAGSASPEPVVSMSGQQQVLTWTLDDVPTNTWNQLVYDAVADDSIAPGTQLTNTAVSSLAGEDSTPASKTVTTTTNGYTQISKTADTPFIPNLDGSGDGEGVWTVSMRSFDPLPQSYTDIIDILPWEGDERGTDYDGSYQLSQVSFPAGSTGTVYYTTADPATLTDDPATAANGGANTPSAIWSTTFTPDATAVRVIGPELAPGANRQFRVHIQTDGAQPLDTFVNRAQGRSQHTRLVTRTSAPMEMAPHYAANLKKYVQDATGAWRDANDVTDYPAFKLGDTVNYRIVVTNIGQGALTNIDVSDDQFPQGSFHVDSLAPGASQTHEYSMVIPGDAVGTLVNTACAEADTPADAGGLEPVINCDPAGRELVNYVTTKVADPESGTAVQVGERIDYTIAVTQQGTVPAEATFTDDLADVLDDARYNRDATATIGTVHYEGGKLLWTGTVPVGQVALVTYSVTVKGTKRLGNRDIVNPVTSPGCVVRDGETVNCDTEHRVPKFDLALTKKVLGSTDVDPGELIRYSLVVSNRGSEVALAPIVLRDKLPRDLELVKAYGGGWKCTVDKKKDEVTCTSDRDLEAGKQAKKVIVVAKPTRAATGRRLVNVAQVRVAGDTVRSNNHDAAAVTVSRPPALPSTGFRSILRSWLF